MVLHLRQPAPRNWAGARCDDGTAMTNMFFEGPEADATAFCRDGCPIIERCLLFALVNNERAGVWGGTTPLERRAIRKRWMLARGREPRLEWRVFEPGEPLRWFTPGDLADGDEEDDDDEP